MTSVRAGWDADDRKRSCYVLLPLANALTGYTVKAMQRKIERGDWPEGRVWKRAPDGHIMIDLVGYQKWVENR